jgi:hypothetical protein
LAELLNRDQYEAELAGKIESLNADHRRELILLLGIPPDIGNVPPSFWTKVEQEAEAASYTALLMAFIAMSNQIDPSGSAAQQGEAYARDEARRMAAKYAELIRSKANEVATGLRGRMSTGELITGRDIRQSVFDALSPKQSAMVAQNAVVTARSAAIIQAAQNGGPVVTDGGEVVANPVLIWELEVKRKVSGHCLFCPLVAGTGFEDWGRFVPGGPACHWGCACGVIVHTPNYSPRSLFGPRQKRWGMVSDAAVYAAMQQSGVTGVTVPG